MRPWVREFLAQYPVGLCLFTLPPLERRSWPEHKNNKSVAIKEKWLSPSSHRLQPTGSDKKYSPLGPKMVAVIEIIQMVWIATESLYKLVHYYPDLNIHISRGCVAWMLAVVFETVVSKACIWVNTEWIINVIHILKSEPIYFSKMKIF